MFYFFKENNFDFLKNILRDVTKLKIMPENYLKKFNGLSG
jgi:hypothetical protein